MSLLRLVPPQKTHCFELLMEIGDGTKRINFLKAVYLASGVSASIEDIYDGQRYEITITPAKKDKS